MQLDKPVTEKESPFLVKFTDFKIKEDHVIYQMEIRGPFKTEFTLNDRYSNMGSFFELISESLENKYSLPLFPKKKFFFNKDPAFLKKRLLELEKFFNEYLAITEVHKDIRVLNYFTSLADRDLKAQIEINKIRRGRQDYGDFFIPDVYEYSSQSTAEKSFKKEGLLLDKKNRPRKDVRKIATPHQWLTLPISAIGKIYAPFKQGKTLRTYVGTGCIIGCLGDKLYLGASVGHNFVIQDIGGSYKKTFAEIKDNCFKIHD